MSRYHSYLNSAKAILEQYDGRQPFPNFIKEFFRQYKKYGSKDRKQIAGLCYGSFRLGKAGSELPVEDRVLTAFFLRSSSPNEMLQHLKPEWNEKASLSFEEKCLLINPHYIHPGYPAPAVFPWKQELSEGIDYAAFCRSFFIQPDLFIRLRPGKEDMVRIKLQEAHVLFTAIGNDCIRIPNSTKIDEIIEVDKEAVIQDYNSQQTGMFLKHVAETVGQAMHAWDCCAASGGKSIMAYDLMPDIKLTVSDARQSILVNLKKRFERAGIRKYELFTADLVTQPANYVSPGLSPKPSTFHLQPASSRRSAFSLPLSGLDLIICDAPCTGSGTWSRTPEQLHYFNEKRIEEYALVQQKILSHVMAYLKPGGFLLYITCSVFKKENEDIVSYIMQNHSFSLQLIKMDLLKGYDKKADTMFAALLQKRSPVDQGNS